jgi:hypothetical protein
VNRERVVIGVQFFHDPFYFPNRCREVSQGFSEFAGLH